MIHSNIVRYLNKVTHNDVMNVLKELPDNSIDCIFADPDYNVGIKYNGRKYTKGFDEYINWCMDWAKESERVLKRDGNFFIINYPKNNAYLRVKLLDDIFFKVNEYVWTYNTNIGQSPRRFTTAHRTVLHCVKSPENKFYKDNVAVPYLNPTDKRVAKLIASGSKGRMPYSWLYYDLVKNVSLEKTHHSCQIPQTLSKTLIYSCTQPKSNDVVFILFGGSGSEAVVCKEGKRNFLITEIDKDYCKLIRKRLKAVDNPAIKIDDRPIKKREISAFPLFTVNKTLQFS